MKYRVRFHCTYNGGVTVEAESEEQVRSYVAACINRGDLVCHKPVGLKGSIFAQEDCKILPLTCGVDEVGEVE